jgi:hypothetical protein
MNRWVLALRVAVALFVIVTPTILFLLLWRGLMRLRDGELVRSVEERMDGPAAPAFEERGPSPAMGEPNSSPASGGSSPGPVRPSPHGEAVVCDRCGGENAARYDYCRECLAPLPGG